MAIVPAGMTVEQWDNKLFLEHINKNWFSKFMGKDMDAMIQLTENLTKKPGDAITVNFASRLKGVAKDGATSLDRNEEELDLRSHRISVREYDHAVTWKEYDQQKTEIQLRQANKSALKEWQKENDRDLFISALHMINGKDYSAASEAEKDAWLTDNADRVLFGSAKANNASNDHSVSLANVSTTLTPGSISLMKRMAKMSNPIIKPFQPRKAIEDSDSYVLFVNPLSMRDLVSNSEFKTHNEQARDRGSNNPLFTGANYVWDNIYIYEIEDIPVLSGVGNTGIDVAPVHLCGAQALCQVWAKRPETRFRGGVENDYARKKGLAIIQWYGVDKLRFGTGATDLDNTKDHGVLTGYFSALADS